MKPKNDMKKLFENADISTNPKGDEMVFDKVLTAQAKALKAKPTLAESNIGRIIMKSRIARLAAAVIIVGISLIAVFVHRHPGEESGTAVSKIAKSPLEMMTAMSLTMAYRRGGIEAVEEQSEKAIRMLGPRPTTLTVRQLLAGTDG